VEVERAGGAERTEERLEVARRALASLQALPLHGSDKPAEQGAERATEIEADIVRDAAIQRFEYTFEATWKAAQAYLIREGLDAASPRSAIRSSFQVGALSEADAQLALEMLGDRNRSVHTCNEGLERTIFSRLETYTELLARWLNALEKMSESW